jgi:hypothetical protein
VGTYTLATLGISDVAYNEIYYALRKAGYDHVFSNDGEINMNGIALIKKCDDDTERNPNEDVVGKYVPIKSLHEICMNDLQRALAGMVRIYRYELYAFAPPELEVARKALAFYDLIRAAEEFQRRSNEDAVGNT